MHTRRTKLNFSVNFLTFGFKVEDFAILRHLAVMHCARAVRLIARYAFDRCGMLTWRVESSQWVE